jgi:hypothetical protein
MTILLEQELGKTQSIPSPLEDPKIWLTFPTLQQVTERTWWVLVPLDTCSQPMMALQDVFPTRCLWILLKCHRECSGGQAVQSTGLFPFLGLGDSWVSTGKLWSYQTQISAANTYLPGAVPNALHMLLITCTRQFSEVGTVISLML